MWKPKTKTSLDLFHFFLSWKTSWVVTWAARSRTEPLQVAALRQNTSTSLNTDVQRCRLHTLCLHKGIIKSALLFFLKCWKGKTTTVGTLHSGPVFRFGTSQQHLPARSAVTGRESFLGLQFYMAKGIRTLLLGQFWTELDSVWVGKLHLQDICCGWNLSSQEWNRANALVQWNSCVPPRLLAWASSHPDITRDRVHENNDYLTFSLYIIKAL